MTVPTAPSFSSSHYQGANPWLRMAREFVCCNPERCRDADCLGPSSRPSGRRHDRGQFSYTGDHFAFHNVTVVPKPYQKPHPPIRVALASAETFGLVGRMGHAIFISANTPIPQLQERLTMYRQARQEAGHTGPADIALRIPAYVAETAERAYSEPEASTMRAIHYAATELIKTVANPEGAARIQRLASTPYDDILKQRVMYGTPEAIADRLQEYQETLGITGVVLEMNYGGRLPSDRVINSIRLLTEKVAPRFN